MSLTLVRTRFSAIAAKIETTPGTDSIAGSPVAGDFTRGVMATLNPSMDTTGQVALFNNFRNGTGGSLFAVVPGNAGNRFSVTMPAVRLLAADPGDRGGLRTNEIRAEANITDASFFLCQY